MQTFRRVSAWLSRKIGFIILAFSLAACLFPGLFSWAVAHTSLFLAVIMFGMGLTIRMEDFRAVFVRPRALAAGCAAQFTVMFRISISSWKASIFTVSLSSGSGIKSKSVRFFDFVQAVLRLHLMDLLDMQARVIHLRSH